VCEQSNPADDDLARVARKVRARIELEKAFGVELLPRAPLTPVEQKGRALQALRDEIGDCRECVFGRTRNRLVFGAGNPDADLMFVGEAPGYEEDRSGEPFVGPAGQLLTRIIQAINMDRTDVYIGNVLKCRPPNNRTPTADEAAQCFPYLRKQIDIILPKIIVALGAPAAQTLLQTTETIGRLRGRFHDLDGILVMPTYHPAYLLRNERGKRPTWEDMKKVRDKLAELRAQK